MPVTRGRSTFPRSRLRAALAALAGLLALWLLMSPQPALANVDCSATAPTLNFGTSLTVTGTINYNCVNFGSTSVSTTLCTGVGTSSFPGTSTQPRLQNGGNQLDYNLYTDPAATVIWTTNNPITRAVTIPAGGTSIGSFTFYGRIRSGQTVPIGTYTGQMFNTRIGFRPAGFQTCQLTAPNLAGRDITLNVQASVVLSCNFGTIGVLNFGTRSALPQAVNATGSVQINCPLNLSWTLTFDGGRNPSVGQRRMRNPTGNFLIYKLYRDSARINLITIGGTITGKGTGTNQTTTIYGRVDAGPPPAIGQYSDFVVVTLSF